MNTQFHFNCDIPEERRHFLRELKTDGVEQLRSYIRESHFTAQQKQVATQWISDYENGLTHEADLRYIIDELKNIEDKFFRKGDILKLSDSLSGKAKGLFTEAEQIASLGLNDDSPILKRLSDAISRATERRNDYYFYRDFLEIKEIIGSIASTIRPSISRKTTFTQAFVSKEIISKLNAHSSKEFDTGRLVRLCEELNSSYSLGNFHACIALTRTILNHVPPIFGQRNFVSVVSKFPNKGSIKQQLEKLEKSTRKIADVILHEAIQERIAPLNEVSIDCKQDLDTLLRECVRKLESLEDSTK